ncbi:hypothetical protein ES703_21521 [subsurface metagenome]
MKLRWDGQFKKVEETNGWAWWGLFVVVVIMEVMVILKILGKM